MPGTRVVPVRIARFCEALFAVLALLGSHGALCAPDSNVPDVLTRKSGLRLEPMSRPAQTYANNCQGCHGEAGVSVDEIPRLAGRVGYFARIPEGREYLVQVPNVALNPSSDQAIAELMNWLLARFSRAQMPEDFVPYTADEVARLRQTRIDVAALRRQLVARLVQTNQIASADALAFPAAAIAAGREKFVQCASCHGADGRSTVMGNYPKIGGQNLEYLVSALKAYRDGRRQGTYAAMMSEVARQLSDEDIANLTAYIQSLAQ